LSRSRQHQLGDTPFDNFASNDTLFRVQETVGMQ